MYMHFKVKRRLQGAIFGRPVPPPFFSSPLLCLQECFGGCDAEHCYWHQTKPGFHSGSAPSLSSCVILSKWSELSEPQSIHDFYEG